MGWVCACVSRSRRGVLDYSTSSRAVCGPATASWRLGRRSLIGRPDGAGELEAGTTQRWLEAGCTSIGPIEPSARPVPVRSGPVRSGPVWSGRLVEARVPEQAQQRGQMKGKRPEETESSHPR
ncbi:unnamed protein product [Protopolystoma xenopodis]|uniref:Uncharacterized protein n=1 Tax=Protopolystoma xenopodis TaxID=117903 RepID=A0A3S5CPP5_9PLAT|nr:unnamed protein product [Protopolystoma xenopodis]